MHQNTPDPVYHHTSVLLAQRSVTFDMQRYFTYLLLEPNHGTNLNRLR